MRCAAASGGPAGSFVPSAAGQAQHDAPSSSAASSAPSEPAPAIFLLDEQIERTLANRDKLLAVLDRPDVPLHNNQRENDLRNHVRRRKISAGTRSDLGRACRDAFHTHMKHASASPSETASATASASPVPTAYPSLPDLARQIPKSAPLPAQ